MPKPAAPPAENTSLDPADWSDLRSLGHRIIDDLFDQFDGLRERPVWRKMPAEVRTAFHTELPHQGIDAGVVYERFTDLVQPYTIGNTHPAFMGWVHGGGTAVGVLAETLAAALNANLGGRDHAPIEVERQVIRWSAELLGLPSTTAGLLVTGTSIANFIGLLVARRAALGAGEREKGVGGARLKAYASAAVHACVPRAMDMSGLGTDALRRISCDTRYRIDLAALDQAIARDLQNGDRPFLVVGSAGTVDTGAVDDLAALADLCARYKLWFHVDGAFGALGMLAPSIKPMLAGIEHADSVGFDFHKWGQAPYDAGCILVRDAGLMRETFSISDAYLRPESRGLAAGEPWPCNLGPDLSRGFRALKVWFSLLVYGTDRLGAVIEQTCALARAMAARVANESELELMAPVSLNIVCFRYRASDGDLDRLNTDLAADIQESGLAVVSTTVLGGAFCLRACVCNHRSEERDIHQALDAVLKFGRKRRQS